MTRIAPLIVLVVAPVLLGVQSAAEPGLHPGRNGPLTAREKEYAGIAWSYFTKNFQPQTCLVNSVDEYPSTSMWDQASYVAALVAAREFELISDVRFDDRMACLLATLGRLPLFQDELPNKAYDTRTATMADYANNPGAIGYSATDLGRMLIWLHIVESRYPHHSEAVQAVVSRWSFCSLLDRCGTMYGALLAGDGVQAVQEGRLGYEEYAAKGFQLWGFDTAAASRPEPYEVARILGVDVPYDARDPRVLGAHTYVVTESYALDGIELNWDLARDRKSDDMTLTDTVAADFADRIYRVQEARNVATGILTARSEHQLDEAPWFVYDTVYSDGYAWNTIADDGRFLPASAALSVKAAFSLWALWDTPYTSLLLTKAASHFDPQRGFYEGVYEHSGEPIKAFTANNNGIILETLLYKVQGKLLPPSNVRVDSWHANRTDARDRCQLPRRQRSPCGPASSEK